MAASHWKPAAMQQPAHRGYPLSSQTSSNLEFQTEDGFTQVNARKNLTQPDTNIEQQKPKPASTSGKRSFPDALKQYVARTFETIPVGQDKEDIEAELKRIITDAYEKDVVWSLQWQSMPLPQEILKKRKEQDGNVQTSEANNKNSDRFSFGIARTTVVTTNSPPKPNPPVFQSTYSPKQASPVQKRKSTHQKLEESELFEKRARLDVSRKFSASTAPSPPLPKDYRNGEPQGLGPVVGRCTELEKRYFRLTSAPNPDAVRPLHILEKTLALLKKKWKTEQNYNYICDQFKSMRQDLTVQHIKNEFTISVYEIHARIALEKGDLGEYNQCQTQLFSLYKVVKGGYADEFRGYYLLYLLHTCNNSDINDYLANLSPAEKKTKGVAHALLVRAALAQGNYHKLFKLYMDCPGMGAYLMDLFIPRERIAALAVMCKAYRPDIGIKFLTDELGFESYRECVEFLCENGAEDCLQSVDADNVRLLTVQARSIFEKKKAAAYARIDIKGQI